LAAARTTSAPLLSSAPSTRRCTRHHSPLARLRREQRWRPLAPPAPRCSPAPAAGGVPV